MYKAVVKAVGHQMILTTEESSELFLSDVETNSYPAILHLQIRESCLSYFHFLDNLSLITDRLLICPATTTPPRFIPT